MSQGKGQWVSKLPYSKFSTLTTGQTFGPFAATPSEALDAIIVMNTLTALTLTDQDGVTLTFTTFPTVGMVLEVSPASITFAPAGAIGGLYRR